LKRTDAIHVGEMIKIPRTLKITGGAWGYVLGCGSSAVLYTWTVKE